jgi:nitrate reductase NapE component
MGAAAPTKRPLSRQRNKPFQPAIGTDFGPVEDVDAKTRAFLAKAVAIFAGTAVAITGGYGLITGNYIPLISVWAIAGPFIGSVVTYYFGPQRNDTG